MPIHGYFTDYLNESFKLLNNFLIIACMDDIDKQIVNLLTLNGRTSNAELAHKIGLSAPSVAERIRRLEVIGVVAGFSL